MRVEAEVLQGRGPRKAYTSGVETCIYSQLRPCFLSPHQHAVLFCWPDSAAAGVSHFVAYETDEMMVDEPGAIAANYRRQRLALDIISAVPFDWIAYGIAAALTTAAVSGGHDPADAAAAAAGAVGAAAASTHTAAGVGLAGAAGAAGAAAAAGKGVGLLSSARAAMGVAQASHVTALSAAAGGAWQAVGASQLNSLVPAIACLKGLHLVRWCGVVASSTFGCWLH